MQLNGISIGFFFAFMALTLLITYWAAKRTTTTEQFFAADGKITAWQNGWALAAISYPLRHSSVSLASSPRTVSMD